jgi:hypothetical protein
MDNIIEELNDDGLIVFSQQAERRGVQGIILCVTHQSYYDPNEDLSGTPILSSTWLPMVRTLDSQSYYLERAKRFLRYKALKVYEKSSCDYNAFEILPRLWQIFDESTFN